MSVQKPDTLKPVEGAENQKPATPASHEAAVEEIGGPKGPEPTRFGDWQFNGRVSDF